MLIEVFDRLTSGKLVSRIAYSDGEITAPPRGIQVRFAEDDENADAWICHDETGLWLSSNAHHRNAGGYQGFRGFELPLADIERVELMVG